MIIDSEVAKLNKVAERILDSANGKPCQRERRAMASEFYSWLVNRKFTKLPKVAERTLDQANGKPFQRQCQARASEYIHGLLMGSLRSCVKLRREYSIEPTALPVRVSIG